MAAERRRIMHLITGLGTGGAEAMLAKLLEGMDSERFESQVLSLITPGPTAEGIRAAGIPVEHLGMQRGVPTPSAFGKLCRLLRKHKPHVLQTWLYHADLMGLAAAHLTGTRRVFWNLRCSDMDLSKYRATTRLTVKLNARLSHMPQLILSNSQAALDHHRSMGYRPRRELVIPNGFDTRRFRPDPEAGLRLRREWGLPSDALVVGLVARLDPMKGHEVFFAMAEGLAKKRAEVHFVLCGDHMEWSNAEVAKMAAADVLQKRTLLLGRRSDVPAVLAAMDVFALSSHSESFPNVLGEAMACGVPCVTTDVGDAAHIVGETGKVVPPADPGALCDAVDAMLGLSPEERKALGDAARKRIENLYSLDAVVGQYEALYSE
jgi:glycosyltransferase involved in cell wall biosynthesis